MDGFTAEFYKHAWHIVGKFVYESLMEAYQNGQLSTVQRRGVICLLPKKGRNPNCIDNFCPITLLNVDRKILSQALASRLKEVLKEYIHLDQRGFLPGRDLKDNIFDFYSILSLTKEEEEENLMLSLDFYKAFDSVEWNYLFKVLHKMEVPVSFIKWVKLIYNSNTSYVINKGELSEPVELSRGLFQGSLLSPLLFLVAIEPLVEAIHRSMDIEGISYCTVTKKCALVADDIICYLKATEASFSRLDSMIQNFTSISGLKLNWDKLVVVPLGKKVGPLHAAAGYNWSNGQLYYLGVMLSMQAEFIPDLNLDTKITQLEQACSPYRDRVVSPLERATIIRFMLSSKLVYPFQMVASSDVYTRNSLIKFMSDFLWNGRKPRMTLQRAVQPVDQGGLALVDLVSQSRSLKFRCLNRVLTNTEELWSMHVCNLFVIPLDTVLKTNMSFQMLKSCHRKKAVVPFFWRDVFKQWCKVHFYSRQATLTYEILGKMPICFNSVLHPHKGIKQVWKYFQILEPMGIQYLPDLLDSQKLNLVGGETRDFLHRCKRNLPRQWLQELSGHFADSHGHPLNALGDWSYDNISSNSIYKCLVSLRAPQDLYARIMHVWQRELQFYMDSFSWNALCKNVKKIRIKKYQSFSILFINRVTWIYGSNSFGQCPFVTLMQKFALFMFFIPALRYRMYGHLF